MSEELSESVKGKVFISYSRKDKEFVRKLHGGLVSSGLDVWVDWEGIPLTADWMAEITAAIQGADAFVFVISPDSLNSKVCGDELALGLNNNKKLIPVLHRVPEKGDPMNPQVGATNWVYLRETDDFDATLPRLVDAILTDLDWVHQHTRLIERSVEWEKSGRNHSFLLRGDDLGSAETWQTQASSQDGREITALQAEYIQASRQDAQRRQRIMLASVSVALVVTVLLAIYALFQRSAAVKQEQIALAQKGVAQAQLQRENNNLQVSSLLGIESTQRNASYEAEQILRQNLSLLPVPLFQFDQDPTSASDEVAGLAYSPDGTRLATASYDFTARVWDVASGKELLRLSHDKEVVDVAFSPDGTRLATASADYNARIWDAVTGELLLTLPHDDEVLDVAFSPDGKQLASGSVDATARIWDAASGELLSTLEHAEAVNQLVYSPDGKYLATAADQAYVWDAQTGDMVYISSHDNTVLSVAFSPDGNRLISGGWDRTARLWDLTTGQEIARLTHDDWVEDVAFSPDGNWIASASDDNSARLWNPTTGVIFHLRHNDFVRLVSFSPDSKWLATGSKDQTASLWEVATGRKVSVMSLSAPASQLIFNAAGSQLATSAENGEISEWDIAATVGASDLLPHAQLVRSMAVSPDGRWLATASDDLNVRLFDTASNTKVATLPHIDFIFGLAFNPESSLLATACADGLIHLWDVKTGEEVQTFTHTEVDWARSVAFSPDGQFLASGSDDAVIKVWDMKTGNAQTFEADDSVWALIFSPDGKTLFAGSAAGQLTRWNLATGQATLEIALPDAIHALAWSADGQWVASASGRATRLWPAADLLKAQSAEALQPLVLQQDDVINAAAFNPDSQLLVTAGTDLSARLWDPASGQELARIVEGRKINAVAFSPDGAWLYIASGDLAKRYPMAQIKLLRPADLLPAVCSRLTRNLTQDEWGLFIGSNDPYRSLCPALP
jgi:WD40 repeat protein